MSPLQYISVGRKLSVIALEFPTRHPYKLYCSHGFENIDTVEICYADIGVAARADTDIPDL